LRDEEEEAQRALSLLGRNGDPGFRAASGTACEHVFVGADARPYARLCRAIERAQLSQAEEAARECSRVGLEEALGLCVLMARDGDRRFERAALRWISRAIEERGELTLLSLGSVVDALGQLQGTASEVARARLALALRSADLPHAARYAERTRR
jgi:hypothetical protein